MNARRVRLLRLVATTDSSALDLRDIGHWATLCHPATELRPHTATARVRDKVIYLLRVNGFVSR